MAHKKRTSLLRRRVSRPKVYSDDHPIKENWGIRVIRRMFFLLFFVVFSGVCLLKLQSLSAESARLDESITALEQQLLDEKERQLDEKTMQEYDQSDEYKEQLAREKVNLIKPGERLYVFGE